jgi:hypothetical protein
MVGTEHVPDASKADLFAVEADVNLRLARKLRAAPGLGGKQYRPLAADELHCGTCESNHEQPSEGQSQNDPSAPHCLLDARAPRLLP